jgi:hypothetical protein
MSATPNRLIDVLMNPSALWQLLREYFSFSRFSGLKPVNDRTSLKEFLNTRASFVAQTSLYGYLRTRAGMRYPELFDDDPFVVSINIAKWQIWLACLSDLAVYAGGLLLQQHPEAKQEQVSDLLREVVDEILADTGVPDEAGEQFMRGAEHVRQRLALCNWQEFEDGEQAFSHSPSALVEWAPIVDELKQMDEEIVTNSVRFRWQKVRQDLRQSLNAAELLGVES